MFARFIPLLSIVVVGLAFSRADAKELISQSKEVDPQQVELFEKSIRPTLVDHCEKCHGEERQRGGLRLDSIQGWMEGGDSGPAITPGDQDSLLLEVMRYDGDMEMPPRGKLPDATIQAFEKWIKLGAYDPRQINGDAKSPNPSPKQVDGSFWSFQPLEKPEIPKRGTSKHWGRSEIDDFILRRIQQNQLQPSEQADRATLIRRLYYDLIGLPPSVSEIQDFVENEDPLAWERLIDELLDRSEFGERWGRHWLDVVRFAESSGGGRTLLFPDAWRYRDYVIESFNLGTPYNEFLMEQIAGDLLGSDDHLKRQRQITATGFLLLGPTNYEMQDKDVLEMDVVDEQLDTIGKSIMGMTIGCARCHDHKFDPIPTADYYALAGIFKSTRSLIHSNVSTWNKASLPLNDQQERLLAEQERALAELRKQLQENKETLSDLKGNRKNVKQIKIETINAVVLDDVNAKRIGDWKESVFLAGFVGKQYIHDENTGQGEKSVIFTDPGTAIGTFKVFASYTHGANRSSKVSITIRDAGGDTTVLVNQRQPAAIHRSFHELGTFTFTEAAPAQITIANQVGQDGVVIADSIILAPSSQSLGETFPAFSSTKTPQQQKEIESLESLVKSLEAKLKEQQTSSIKRPAAMAVEEVDKPGDIAIAIRGVTSDKGDIVQRGVLSVANWEEFPKLDDQQSGRLEFAKWITHPRHPLTARVMANRIWYWMMGRGLVTSLDNFGSTGSKPSHPELLDYLASELIESNWSIKKLIKLIAMSSTYQQSSDSTQNTTSDPDNHLYARANRKRLRAEDLRDTLLSIGNSLDSSMGGASIKAGTKIEYNYQFDSHRRSVYLPVFRNTLPEVFEVFDFADPNIQQGKRNESTVASQALWLMNHKMILEQSEKAAIRLLSSGIEPKQRVNHAFLQTLGRIPTKMEREILETSILSINIDTSDDLELSEVQDRWALVYQTLCQSIDFLYVN